MSKFFAFLSLSLIQLGLFAQDNLEDTIIYQPKDWYSTVDTMSYHLERVANVYNESKFGFRQPRSGSAYAGMTVFNPTTGQREYLINELSDALDPGQEYEITYYVCLSQYSDHWTGSLGAHLANKYKENKDDLYNSLSPQVNVTDHEVLSTSTRWKKVTGTYKANGGEKFLYLGTFGELEANKDAKPINLDYAHYFIEDVSVKNVNGGKNLVVNGSFEDYEIYQPKKLEEEEDDFVDVEIVTLADIKVEEIQVDQKIVLNNILFETGKSILLAESYQELDHLIEVLNENPTLHIKITGHTDNVGSEEFNQQLSGERALSVVDYLLTKDIDTDRLGSEGHGSAEPVRSNRTEEGRRLNRRVEFTVVKL